MDFSNRKIGISFLFSSLAHAAVIFALSGSGDDLMDTYDNPSAPPTAQAQDKARTLRVTFLRETSSPDVLASSEQAGGQGTSLESQAGNRDYTGQEIREFIMDVGTFEMVEDELRPPCSMQKYLDGLDKRTPSI